MLGVVGIDLDICKWGSGIDRGGGVGPVGSAVNALPDAGAAGCDVLSYRGDGGINHVGVGGIDGHLRDGLAVEVAGADEGPGCAGVGAFQYAAAVEGEGRIVGFTGAGVDDVCVTRGNGDRAGGEGGLRVSKRNPGGSTVDGFPDAATCRAGIDHPGIGGIGGERGDTAAASV